MHEYWRGWRHQDTLCEVQHPTTNWQRRGLPHAASGFGLSLPKGLRGMRGDGMSIRAQLEALVAKAKVQKEAAAKQRYCSICEESIDACMCEALADDAAHG